MIVSRERVGSSYELMENRGFQDWLKAGDILQVSEDLPNLAFRQRLTEQEKHLAELLEENSGYLIPPHVPYRHNGVDPQNVIDMTRVYIWKLRKKAEDPTMIFEAPGFGYGLGIEGMRISREQGRLLYRLYLEEDEFINRWVLAKDLYGDSSVYEIALLQVHVARLRRRLRGTRARVETGEECYRTFLENPNSTKSTWGVYQVDT